MNIDVNRDIKLYYLKHIMLPKKKALRVFVGRYCSSMPFGINISFGVGVVGTSFGVSITLNRFLYAMTLTYGARPKPKRPSTEE